MNSTKRIWIDTETTGITEQTSMVQFSAIVDINGEAVDVLDIKCRPTELVSIESLKIIGAPGDTIGQTLDKIMVYQDPSIVVGNIIGLMDKYIKFKGDQKFQVAGYLIDFDIDVINRFLTANKSSSRTYWWFENNSKFDVFKLFNFLQMKGKVPQTANNKLTTVCAAMGIELKSAHDSMQDIVATRELGKMLWELF